MAAPDFLERDRERERRLWEELASEEIVDLVGVVKPRGVVGSQSQGDKQWTLQIWLLAWRIDGGPVSEQELVARKKTGRATLHAVMKEFDDYDIVRMRARVAVKNSFGSPQAAIVRLPQLCDDREMVKIARALKKPLRIKDERFGTLTLERAGNTFDTKVKWGERRVRLTLGAGRDGTPDKSLRHARALFQAPRKWETAVMRQITGMYDLWREAWWVEGEKLLTKKEFAGKVRLETITVEPDGGFAFWFDDGDLFAGHGIFVAGKVSGGVQEATLVG